MGFKIVSDSSSNVFSLPGMDFASVPLKIIAGEKEYVDTPSLDLPGMVNDLKRHKGKSGSSCPNVHEWLDAFGQAEQVFGVTISKNVSGSYNAARDAAREYESRNPGRRVFIFDSLTAGPQQAMVVEKLRDLIQEGLDFDTIREKALEYHNHTHTIFCLESLTNLARNGRVNPAVAKIAGVLGIRVAGEARGGRIVPVHKTRGARKTMQTLLEMMVERGIYDGAQVRVAHCFAQDQAEELRKLVLERFPQCRFRIEPTTALCSFYAEVGGLIVGFEGRYNKENNNKDF